MTIRGQAQKLYQILLNARTPLPVTKLAGLLRIYPNSVYRLTKLLIEMGLVEKTGQYPIQFFAKPKDEGLSLFLLSQNNWFSKNFSGSGQKISPSKKNNPDSSHIKISFIQSREELFNLSITEINRSKVSIDLLRSGQEIPAEVMLAMIRAKERGVVTRMLVQEYCPENREQISYWKQNGILVKKTDLCHIRLMIYDSKALYFMSYRHTDSDKDLGMQVSYPPFAAILSQFFNQWWQKAKTIS